MENEFVIKCRTMKNVNISYRDYCKIKGKGVKTEIYRNNIKFTLLIFLLGLLLLLGINLTFGQTSKNFNIIFLLIWGGLTLVLGLSFQFLGLIYLKTGMKIFSNNPISDKNVTLIFSEDGITLIHEDTSKTVPYSKSHETKSFFWLKGLIGVEKESLSEEEIVQVRKILKRKTKLISQI